ncbi:branched-chain amino acid ABC transporter permease [Arcobacter sp. LA11]|uniref:branched-chain amino acid ABC transporter permease n=1 Tax=Arcobacter sp. LA11 TaxID=1898176 RepID=UPI000933C4F2|nr:branched-chain amino acid ABC transporter permease [Arcobacter sp. LA11]
MGNKGVFLDRGIVTTIVVLCLIPFLLQNSFHYEIAIMCMLNAVICIGLNMLVGYTGQISLGHGAFAGLGAYVAVVLSTTFEFDPVLSIIVSVIVLAALAFFISKPVLKLEGHYLAMATLAVGIIISIVLTNEDELTGGPDGMGVSEFHILGYVFENDIQWYILSAIFLVFSIWALQNVVNSPFGRILRCIRDSETAAKAIGADVPYYKTYVFVISVVIATIAGSLYSYYTGFISPEESGFMRSIELVVMIVFGGLGRIYGAVFGAIIITALPQFLTFLHDYEHMVFGAIIIFVMIFMPKGIVSLFDVLKVEKKEPKKDNT